MCRYAASYKAHFVCFACRKAFKKPAIEEFHSSNGRGGAFSKLRYPRAADREKFEQRLGTTAAEMRDDYLNAVSACPECRGRMVNMGLDFKAPRHGDIEAWKVAAAMHENGFIFSSCGCSGPGYTPPAKLDGMKEFLEEHSGPKSAGEKLLATISERRDRA